MLPDKQRNCTIKNGRIPGLLEINPDHLRQKRRLGPVEIVHPSTIRHKPIILDKIQEILNLVPRDPREVAPAAQQPVEDPVRVPIVGLAEATPRDDEGPPDGKQAVLALGADGGLVDGPRQVGPQVDDSLGELPVDGVCDPVEEARVDGQGLRVYGDDLLPGRAEVGAQEVQELGVVLERLRQLVIGGLDLFKWDYRWPENL